MASFDQGIEIIVRERGAIHSDQSSARSLKSKMESALTASTRGRREATASHCANKFFAIHADRGELLYLAEEKSPYLIGLEQRGLC